jgi:hypothetical protein
MGNAKITKGIVFVQNVGIFGLVMIGMKIPHQSMHQVFWVIKSRIP